MARKKDDKMALAAAALFRALQTGLAQHAAAATQLYDEALAGADVPEVELGAVKNEAPEEA